MTGSTKKRFGENLKKVRLKLDLSQGDVAKRSNIHVNYYARIERGEENPSFEVLEKIAKALNVKSAEILPF